MDEMLERRLGELSTMLLAEETVDTTLRRVAALSVSSIPACNAAGVSLAHDGQITTSVATDGVALRVDSHQYSVDEGPCLEAVRTGHQVRIDSMKNETRWPKFTKAAATEVSASLSLPLRVRGAVVGALNLYSTSRPFLDADRGVGEAFAEQAAVALANAQAYAKTRELVDQLTQALESRDVIGQAKGLIMEREGIGADEAFNVLRRASQARNVKLRDIAQQLIDEARSTDGQKPG
jgi:GAF domain-containing protein